MKKCMSFILTLVFVLSLCACGGAGSGEGADTSAYEFAGGR